MTVELDYRRPVGKADHRGARGDDAGLGVRDVSWANFTRAPARATARCLFVHPGITCPGWGSLKAGGSNEAVYMFHGAAYVSAALKARGHLAWLLDARACRNWADLARRIAAEEYDVALVGFLSVDTFAAACAVRLLKEVHPDRPVVVGGVHVSVCEDEAFPSANLADYWLGLVGQEPRVMREFLDWRGENAYDPARFPCADCVVWNEAELAVCKLAEMAAMREPLPPLVNAGTLADVGAMPMPDRDLFDADMEAATPLLPFLPTPFATITFGRGCPFRCGFCNVASQLSSSKVRTKSVECIAEELDALVARHGRLGSLMIHDDIIMYPKWIAGWCVAIRERFGYLPFWLQMRADFVVRFPDLMREMAETGMTWVSVGIESGSQRLLDMLQKGTTVEDNVRACAILDGLGVNVFGNWMLGLPTETPDDVRATADLMRRVRPSWHSASVYCDYPGTSLSRWLRAEGMVLPEWYDRSHYPWQRSVRGVDYALALRTRAQVTSECPNHPRRPKLWKEMR